MVYNLTHGRRITPAGSMPNTASIDVQGDIEFIKINGVWVPKLPYTLQKTNSNAAVANGASLTIYTVTAGKAAHVAHISISGSIAGFYNILYGATNIVAAYLAVGAQYTWEPDDGSLFETTGLAFAVVNNSGAAAAVAGNIVLAEYTP